MDCTNFGGEPVESELREGGVRDDVSDIEDEEEFIMSALACAFVGRPVLFPRQNGSGEDVCVSGFDVCVGRGDNESVSYGDINDLAPAAFEFGRHPKRHFEESIVCGDYHAWVVDRNNVVHDYPTDQLQIGSFATPDIVRRPWDVNLVCHALPKVISRVASDPLIYLSGMGKGRGKFSPEQLLALIRAGEFPQWMCYRRAEILRDSNPDEYSLVIGSLGYRQADGSVVWLCG